MRVLIPEDPALAVLKGAVQFGFRPDFVRTRIARKTYGVGISNIFDPSKHKIQYKIRVGNFDICDNLFDTFIRKNNPVELDSCKLKTYTPTLANKTEIIFQIYSSDLELMTYEHIKLVFFLYNRLIFQEV